MIPLRARSRLAVAALVVLSPGAADAQPTLAITHVSVIDGRDSTPRAGQTVVIRGTRIVAVTSAGVVGYLLAVNDRKRWQAPPG